VFSQGAIAQNHSSSNASSGCISDGKKQQLSTSPVLFPALFSK